MIDLYKQSNGSWQISTRKITSPLTQKNSYDQAQKSQFLVALWNLQRTVKSEAEMAALWKKVFTISHLWKIAWCFLFWCWQVSLCRFLMIYGYGHGNGHEQNPPRTQAQLKDHQARTEFCALGFGLDKWSGASSDDDVTEVEEVGMRWIIKGKNQYESTFILWSPRQSETD